MSEDLYIIVQASGLGTRMRDLTRNRPKALISVEGQPLIFHLFNKYPQAHFIVLGYYKFDVLKKYLKHFSPTPKLKVIKSGGSSIGNNSGLSKAIKLVPKNSPIMIVWSDLLHQSAIDFAHLDSTKDYIGLSGKFYCRWSYSGNILREKRSKKYGVAGLFIFKNKKGLDDIPPTGEFCEYLKKRNYIFEPLSLHNHLQEIGTRHKYTREVLSKPVSRPFNRIHISADKVIKIPLNDQGTKLAEHESNWYREFGNENWNFIPKIYELKPVSLAKIKGKSLYHYHFPLAKKKKLLQKIVKQLEVIHSSRPPRLSDFSDNNFNAYLAKTKQRLKSVISLIPFGNNKTITINGSKCKNPLAIWEKVESTVLPIFRNDYVPIHGDITFSNILYQKSGDEVYFIDPRGYFGDIEMFGDVDYDWAKLYYSVVGNYDQFNHKRFKLVISDRDVSLKIRSNGYSKLEPLFFELTNTVPQKIKLLHAIIWLSLSAYAWDDYDSLCGAFYQGTFLLNEFNSKTF